MAASAGRRRGRLSRWTNKRASVVVVAANRELESGRRASTELVRRCGSCREATGVGTHPFFLSIIASASNRSSSPTRFAIPLPISRLSSTLLCLIASCAPLQALPSSYFHSCRSRVIPNSDELIGVLELNTQRIHKGLHRLLLDSAHDEQPHGS